MKKTTALAILKKHSARLKNEFHVQSLYLFGSTARDEAGAKSDVDILVEFSSNEIGFFEFIQLKDYLELVLKTKVDLVTRDSVKKWMLAELEKDAVRAA
jgi:predicted nucleotidyltransferase